MSEEVKLKVSMPMFEEGELERFDSNIHSIVEEYSKMLFKEKDQILTQRIIMKQEEEIHKKEAMYDSLAVDYRLAQEEIERLNNIINELEKDLQSNMAYYDNLYEELDEQEYIDKYFALKEVFEKLQELKGSVNNDN